MIIKMLREVCKVPDDVEMTNEEMLNMYIAINKHETEHLQRRIENEKRAHEVTGRYMEYYKGLYELAVKGADLKTLTEISIHKQVNKPNLLKINQENEPK